MHTENLWMKSCNYKVSLCVSLGREPPSTTTERCRRKTGPESSQGWSPADLVLCEPWILLPRQSLLPAQPFCLPENSSPRSGSPSSQLAMPTEYTHVWRVSDHLPLHISPHSTVKLKQAYTPAAQETVESVTSVGLRTPG